MKSFFFKKILCVIKEPETRKFLLIAIFSALFVLSLVWFLTEFFHLHYTISVLISVETSIVGTFFALDKWAFKNQKKKHNLIFRLARYNAVCLISLGVNILILVFLSVNLEIYYLLSEIVAMLFSGGTNFLLVRNFVMSKHLNT